MRDTKISVLLANAQADCTGALLNNGYLRIYGGDKPADANEPAAGDALATLRFGSPAFRPAVGGVIESYPLVPDLNTSGHGEPTWFRAYTQDDAPVFDGTVGRQDCNINIPGDPAIPLVVHPGGEFHVGSIVYAVRMG